MKSKLRYWRVVAAALLLGLALSGAVEAQENIKPEEQACRDNLQALGDALKFYEIDSEGKPPSRLSELYKQGLVPDLAIFSCPASGKRITEEAQIDQLTDYEIVAQASGDQKRRPMIKEKYGYHDGQALVFYSDRSIGKEKGPAPPGTPQVATITPPASQPQVASVPPKPKVPPKAAEEPGPAGPTPMAATYYQRGLELSKQQKWQEAAAAFREAIRLNSAVADYHYHLALTQGMLKQWTEAEKAVRRALSLKPNQGLYLTALGEIYFKQSRLTEALQAFQQAVKVDPGDAGNQYNLGLALTRKGQYAAGLGPLKTAVQLKPDYADAHLALAYNYASQGDHVSSERHLRTAIRLKPRDGLIRANLATALLNQGKRQEALQEAQAAISLGYRDPKHPVFNKLGVRP
jgi:Tfp pilus assembly protein PilF